MWVKQTFEEADKNGDGLLNIEEIHQLMHKLNVNLPRRKVRQMFQEADTDENQGTLTFEEFCVFYKMMSLRRDLYLLLLNYSDKKDHLTLEELAQFLKVEQKMSNVTTDYCLDIVRKFEVSEENKAKNVLGIEGFTNFMRSPACDIFNPLHHEVYQDMDQPLCNYYIASSHNTYLTGDQLLSQSKVDMYARVLQEGCRCVEVDCWDGPDGEPVVHHGYTLTSKILFRDVVETINKHAFVKNEFPVILSIENHCSVQQQRKIAQYLKGIFGDKLDLSSVDTGETKQLPSPQSLKGKILVKGKKLPYHLGDDAEEGEVSDEDSADEIEDECKFKLHYNNGTTEHQVESFIRKKLESLLKESQIRDKEDPDSFTVRALLRATHEGLNAHLKQHPDVKENGKKSHGRTLMTNFGKHKQKTTKSRSKSYSTDDEEDTQQNPGKETGQLYRLGRRRKTMKLCRELSDLVVYTNSVAAQDIVDDGTTGNVLSFSETRAHQVVQQKSEQFMIYNQKQLTRIYPSAYRIDSSNFNPLPYWNAGCQLVALNYQSEGRMMQLNRAKFKTNGNCGYVLKPQQMCKGTFNPYSGDPLPANPKKQLILKVISGQQLPKPPDSMFGDRGEIIDPFVEVEIIGLPVDCCKDQTRVVDDNGFNPVWEETLTFTVHMPDIALVRFLVWDHDPIGRDFVGQRTVTFSSLVPGYRHVYLEGLTEASIFVHITINEIYGKWSPLILNPSYTILHFLGATKSRQLQGLKGLFNKNPRHGSSENNSHYVRKRSIGDRILRRTASAPAKGRKKSKMGFQEMVEIKDSVSEAARDQDGVLRRTTRSLQERPVSLPVDKTLLGALSLPLSETAKDTEGKENSLADDKDGRRKGKASIKDQHFPNFNKKLSSSSSALLHKDPRPGGSAVSVASASSASCASVTGEQLGAPGLGGGRTRSPAPGGCQEQDCPRKPRSPRQHLAPEPALTAAQGGVSIQAPARAGGSGEDRSPRSGSRFSPSHLEGRDLEGRDLEGGWVTGRAAASLSLSDVSLLCAERPASRSSAGLQDSDVSHPPDTVPPAAEGGPGSSISALIGPCEEAGGPGGLAAAAPPHSTRVVAGHPPLPALDPEPAVEPDAATGKCKPCLARASPARMPKGPEASAHTLHPTTCATAPPPPPEDPLAAGNHRPGASATCPCRPPRSPGAGQVRGAPGSRSPAPAPPADRAPRFHPGDRSVVGAGDAAGPAHLPAAAAERPGDAAGPLAAPLHPGRSPHAPDPVPVPVPVPVPAARGNGRCPDTPHPRVPGAPHSAPESTSGLPCPGAAAPARSRRSPPDAHAGQARAPAPALQLPSPCKSKSLGDLTSEDIACNFESKYQCISRSFVATGLRDQKAVALAAAALGPMDALTEQLRRLVALDPDDGCQVPRAERDASPLPRALVRKLSSRSQSRVRNIASRARERQEAGKQRGAKPGPAAGVVLRHRAAPPPAGTRHSTGSYIAGFLRAGAEDRGIPEGACAALRPAPGDHAPGGPAPGGHAPGGPAPAARLCSHGSLLHTEPGGDDKPEIYFLLRL
ncbi:1-phosphatidylinositol 4,5-bisphosphate phosphodiesterase eta-1 [Vulpes lagopus]